jgi:hypothetical protein
MLIGKGVIREDHAFFVIGGKKSAEGAKDQKPKQKPDQEPLTLALSLYVPGTWWTHVRRHGGRF